MKLQGASIGRRALLSSLLLGCALLVLAAPPAMAKPRHGHAKAAAKPAPLFGDDPAIAEFATAMAERHGFDALHLRAQLAQLHVNPAVLQAILPPLTPTQRSWERYRARFLSEQRIDAGVLFWQTHAATLARARAEYGVPEEIIVAIIGVETFYGRNTGKFGVMEALATLAFRYPPRAEFFRSELEQFLLLARENGFDPTTVKGSFAGAIGIPQFMPGSQRRYAVDFDGDRKIDLTASVDDAIGSVARFLERHGWQAGETVAAPLAAEIVPDPAWIAAGIRPTLKVAELAGRGIGSATPRMLPEQAALIDLVTPDAATEYWLGFENFYVITRYNRSSFYAMAVFQLAEAIKARR